MNLPTITPPADAPQPLRLCRLPGPPALAVQQQFNVASYRLGDEQWVKANIALWHGALLVPAVLASFGLPVLILVLQPAATRPLPPKCSGCAIWPHAGCSVPTVLAAQEDGFIMRHLGGRQSRRHRSATRSRPPCPPAREAVLRLWLQGLRAIELVQPGHLPEPGLARNPVRCPDGGLHRL